MKLVFNLLLVLLILKLQVNGHPYAIEYKAVKLQKTSSKPTLPKLDPKVVKALQLKSSTPAPSEQVYVGQVNRKVVVEFCEIPGKAKYATSYVYRVEIIATNGKKKTEFRTVETLAVSDTCSPSNAGISKSELQAAAYINDGAIIKGVIICKQGEEKCAVWFIRNPPKKPNAANGRSLLQQQSCGTLNDACGWSQGTPQTPPEYYGECCQGFFCQGSEDEIYASCYSNCFPGNAVVEVLGRGVVEMSQTKIGDKVLAGLNADGSLLYDEIYMFGHKDSTSNSTFIKIETESGAVLRLTYDHHVPALRASRGSSLADKSVIASQEVDVGDLVQVFSHDTKSAAYETVVSKTLVQDRGLYNPYTLSGFMVVDGIVASCHSSSFLDPVFDYFGISVHYGYQAAFAPLRVLYSAMGPERFSHVEFIIDAVAEKINSGQMASTALMTGAAALAEATLAASAVGATPVRAVAVAVVAVAPV